MDPKDLTDECAAAVERHKAAMAAGQEDRSALSTEPAAEPAAAPAASDAK